MGDYQPPNWVGKPPGGLHLDVYKGDQLIQKLMADERPFYLFGRNRDQCQFTLDHSSCSRVHAALLYHKHLKRSFLVDLGSTHGTFLGTIRLERHKPQPIKTDSTFHFGASTRHFMLREKPPQVVGVGDGEAGEEGIEGGFLGVADAENALDELTEFNTAHNRRVAPVLDDPTRARRKRKSVSLRFAEEDTIINPEDVDPSVGRFRNLIQTSIVVGQAKRPRPDATSPTSAISPTQRRSSLPFPGSDSAQLYSGLPDSSLSALGGVRSAPNLAPDVSMEPLRKDNRAAAIFATTGENEPAKKKYAKEAWPGRAPSARTSVSSNLLM